MATVKATKGIPSVPDVPPKLDIEGIYRILEPLTRIINIRQGKFDPLDRWITQQDLIDAGLQTETAATSPVPVIPPTSVYDFVLDGDIIGGPTAMGTGQPTITMQTAIDLPNVVCIDGGDAAETYPGAVTGPYGVAIGGGGVPDGGTEGQILIKQSATDGDAIWDDYGAAPASSLEYCPGYTSYTRVDDDTFTIDLVDAANLFYPGRRVKFDQAGAFTYGAISSRDFDITNADDTTVNLTMEGADTVPTGSFDVCLVSSATAWSPISGDPFSGAAILDIATGVIGATQWWIIVGTGGKIAHSSDGGATWALATTPTTDDMNAVVYDSTNSEFYAGGEDETVWKSTDGTTWSAVTTDWTHDAGDYIVDMTYGKNQQVIYVMYYDSSASHYDMRYTLDSFATSVTRALSYSAPIITADESASGGSSVWDGASATVSRWFSNYADTTATTDKSMSTTVTAVLRTWISVSPFNWTFTGDNSGNIEDGVIGAAGVLDDLNFPNSIREFAYSELHARTVAVGDAGQIGYKDDSGITTADGWTGVENGFAPLANITHVEFNESDGVFVAVADNGQICRSSNGTN